MKVKITITGKVHDVGYRPFLLDLADSLLIERFDARNVFIKGKQTVVVLVDGDDETVNNFIELVKSEKPENAVVEDINVEHYDGFVRSIDSYRQSLMINQLNKIVQVGLQMLKKQDLMLQKQDLMLQKQDETIKIIREENEKTREYLGSKIDHLSEKVDHLGEKVDNLGEKIDRLGDKVDNLGEKIDCLGEKVDNLGNKIDRLGEKIDQVGEKVDKLGEKIDHVGKKIDTAKDDVVHEIRELRTDLKTYLDERLRKIESEINVIKSKLGMI